MIEVEGVRDIDLMGKVAVVTADKCGDIYFVMNGEYQDCTGFYNWVRLWKGKLYGYDWLKIDYSVLEKFSAVILDGNPVSIEDIIEIGKRLKGKVVTMWQPEGDISLYDQYGINTFNPAVYMSWNAVDVIIPMEDNEGYYSSLTDTPVRFVDVPIDERMECGEFLVPMHRKTEHIVIYGDNNPNGPITVIGCARRLKKPVKLVEIKRSDADLIVKMFNVKVDMVVGKLGQYPFFRLLGSSWLHIYPTRNVGAAREPMACAAVGTPCIGSDRSHTQKRLFPKLACDVYDVDTMVKLAQRLYDDKDFYKEVVDYAWEQLKFYTIESTKKRFLEAYVMGRKQWGK